MKYVIETTEYGCIETLEFSDGSKFTRRNERTDCGCKAIDDEFDVQLVKDGFCEEIVEKVDELFSGFFSLHFLEIAELDN
jgi:hypothetical protein